MKVLEIQGGKLTLEYQDGSIGSVESREHALLVVRALNSIEPDSVLTNHEAENVRIAIMVAFKDVSSLEVHETHNEPGVVMSRQEYRQRLVDEMVSKIVSTSHENNETHTIHLVRGIGGSGKTTYAKTLQEKLSIRTLIETVDIESSKIADAVVKYNHAHNRSVRFGAIHYASDYIGKPDESFQAYNLTNEHDENPQTWKDAVLADIFEVIVSESGRNFK